MLKANLEHAVEQYLFDRVETIRGVAAAGDSDYGRAVREVQATLDCLLEKAKALQAEHPELTGLVMEFETATAAESWLASKISYRQGLRDLCRISGEFVAFLRE